MLDSFHLNIYIIMAYKSTVKMLRTIYVVALDCVAEMCSIDLTLGLRYGTGPTVEAIGRSDFYRSVFLEWRAYST